MKENVSSKICKECQTIILWKQTHINYHLLKQLKKKTLQRMSVVTCLKV